MRLSILDSKNTLVLTFPDSRISKSLVQRIEGKYLVTIEGNSNNRVESKRRHLSTIYALADWIEPTCK